jgi:hypothetical protein
VCILRCRYSRRKMSQSLEIILTTSSLSNVSTYFLSFTVTRITCDSSVAFMPAVLRDLTAAFYAFRSSAESSSEIKYCLYASCGRTLFAPGNVDDFCTGLSICLVRIYIYIYIVVQVRLLFGNSVYSRRHMHSWTHVRTTGNNNNKQKCIASLFKI